MQNKFDKKNFNNRKEIMKIERYMELKGEKKNITKE